MSQGDTVKKPIGLRRLVSVCIAKPLASTPITPGQLIAAQLAASLVAAVLLSIGPSGFPIAAGVLLLALLLQRSAGQLSLERAGEAITAERTMLLCNSASHILVFSGLGAGLMGGEYGSIALGMGLLAGLALAVMPWMVRRLAIIDGKRSDEFGNFAGLEADDLLMLAVPLALWASWAEGLLLITACAAPTFAVAFFITHYRKFSAHW